ncbi:MAG: chalcone isomerase family protein [Gemmatimonadales bacterium]|jgi:hypothetical protein
MRKPVAGLVLVGLLAPTLAAQTPASIEEPSSHVPFPVTLSVADGGEHALTGMGLRTRTILKIKVYAFGIYVEPEEARARLASFAGQSARDLEDNDAFYETLLEMQLPMSLRLVMTRDVDGETMADAFDGALRPRVEEAAAERNMPGGVAALQEFRSFFSVDEMTEDSELLFTCWPDGRMHTTVKGERRPELRSQALCWALFDVYLGEDPISGDGKKKVIRRIPEILGG